VKAFQRERKGPMNSQRRIFDHASAAIASSYGARIATVENPQLLLRVDGHVGYPDHAAHKRRPRFFGNRLQLSEIPELLLIHPDLGDPVFEHPAPE
jgi:hypothetical protein